MRYPGTRYLRTVRYGTYSANVTSDWKGLFSKCCAVFFFENGNRKVKIKLYFSKKEKASYESEDEDDVDALDDEDC
jgi:hypothetical protein